MEPRKNNPYPIMEAEAAPSDNPQKLGLRASTAMTWSKGGGDDPVDARGGVLGVGTHCGGVLGIGALGRASGVDALKIERAALRFAHREFQQRRDQEAREPTMKNAMRQLMRLVM